PKMAEVQKNAALGEANANRDSTMGKSLAERDGTVTSSKAQEEAQLARISAELNVSEADKNKNIKLHAYNSEMATAKANSDISYDLQKAKMQQLLTEESLGVSLVEKTKQVEVERKEI